MGERRLEQDEIDRRLAALEQDLERGQATVQTRRWRRAELLGSARRDADGDSGIGGLGFLLGVGLVLFGVYAFFSNVVVGSGFLGLFGFGFGGIGGGAAGFGWSLLPLLAGIALIVVRPRAVWGWGVTALAIGFIFFEVLGTLHLYFRPVTLTGLIIMLLPLGLGIGLILRSVASSLRRG